MKSKMQLAITVTVLALVSPAPSHALDDVANGKRLANQWCASCHLATPEQKEAKADVPPFMTIANRAEEELQRLPLFLANPAHSKPATQMPDFNLSRQAIADLVAYIRSLKAKPASSSGATGQ